MARLLGQQFIVENVPGAGGTTGSTRAIIVAGVRVKYRDGSLVD
jgi:tripartite-type tricarboxylate transporter receptor subunit TctC